MNSDIRYFMFSREQKKMQQEMSRRIGKNFVPKKVFVNGQEKEYTEILKDSNKSRYTDAILVASGDLKQIKYTV